MAREVIKFPKLISREAIKFTKAIARNCEVKIE
jgi:hypothetical protein